MICDGFVVYMTEKIVALLNNLLAKELVASQVYTLFGIILEHWGVIKMSEFFFLESTEEMGHVKKLGQRIAFLNGQVLINHQDLAILHAADKCDDVKKIVDFSLDFEEKAVQAYRDAINICENDVYKDFGTADLLHTILQDEEHHVDFFHKELKIIKQIGIALYVRHKI